MLRINTIYKRLLACYGLQGWWPYNAGETAKEHNETGYHPGNYQDPDWTGKFEIYIGAVLTQNTSWNNVRRALAGMKEKDVFSPLKIAEMRTEDLGEIIRASGYYNQKAKKLKILSEFIISGNLENSGAVPSRNDLLGIWGIGPETADSILLYAYSVLVFVIDAYTRRIFSRLGLIKVSASYDEIQRFFTGRGSRDYTWANEYHALIVKHAVERCRTKPECLGCPLRNDCGYCGGRTNPGLQISDPGFP